MREQWLIQLTTSQAEAWLEPQAEKCRLHQTALQTSLMWKSFIKDPIEKSDIFLILSWIIKKRWSWSIYVIEITQLCWPSQNFSTGAFIVTVQDLKVICRCVVAFSPTVKKESSNDCGLIETLLNKAFLFYPPLIESESASIKSSTLYR